MSEHITVRGFVATDPQVRMAQAGFSVGNFRLAATDRRFDREANAWVDGQTNWFTINMFRALALNAGASLAKGMPVIITGRLKVRPWEAGDRTGTAVEIEADSIGHDLTLGTARFSRSSGRTGDATAAGGPVVDAGDAPAEGPFGEDDEPRVDRSTGEVLEDGPDAPDEAEVPGQERDLTLA
ncbi:MULTISPECIES: single-stranded DNA-binding protein [Micrococcaceae]|uniref:single-stranded DNA-binding protein n=1 Tax=Micrococcaceae TaxID=1268 RepID=UPI00160BDCD3|nr:MULTISPECIES: single-stranded DNA-binding protein [Micrococcaceae]MBB5748626.1 single-strand DNA-binding protein [Micrococcus sp. TA1]HRO30136.1 single-stranded DNA-binding protein [Citricoccus sp.]HRO94750.1 single-stranded DNA-binding protein [Citricoccus sp.]